MGCLLFPFTMILTIPIIRELLCRGTAVWYPIRHVPWLLSPFLRRWSLSFGGCGWIPLADNPRGSVFFSVAVPRHKAISIEGSQLRLSELPTPRVLTQVTRTKIATRGAVGSILLNTAPIIRYRLPEIRIPSTCAQDNKSRFLDRHLYLLLHLWPIRASSAHGPEHATLFL